MVTIQVVKRIHGNGYLGRACEEGVFTSIEGHPIVEVGLW